LSVLDQVYYQQVFTKCYNYLPAYLQQTQTYLQTSTLLKTHVHIFTQTHVHLVTQTHITQTHVHIFTQTHLHIVTQTHLQILHKHIYT
jgi:hypothetical protein